MLSKKELIDLYVVKKFTTYEISEKCGVHRSTISNWLKKYELQPRQRHTILNETILTKIQKELILGSILGDAHIELMKSGNLARFIESHSIKQKTYLNWKSEILHNISRPIKNYSCINKKTNKQYFFCNYYTNATKELLGWQKDFYNKKQKIVNKEIVKDITPFSLAVWYMDDGSIDKISQRAFICSDCFTLEEHKILQGVLKENFNLNSKIVKYKEYNRLHFTVVETRKLCEIIRPYVIKSMEYKLTNCCESADNIQQFSQI